jgi:hypothetical protein
LTSAFRCDINQRVTAWRYCEQSKREVSLSLLKRQIFVPVHKLKKGGKDERDSNYF